MSEIPGGNSTGIDFFIPNEEQEGRRSIGDEAFADSGNQMIVTALSGEHYTNLDLTIRPGSNIVIIGDNVAARQELIRDIANAPAGSSPNFQLPRDARIEFVTPGVTTEVQNPTITLRDFFLDARGIAGAETRLAELWTQAADDPNAMREAGELQEKFEQANGWEADREIEALLDGLRVRSSFHDTVGLDSSLSEMSSGQLSKAIIGRALFSKAGIIAMDDPSVHLDVHSKEWLAEYLRTSDQATIIATSDMEFAEMISNRVIEILDSRLVLNIGTNLAEYYPERAKLLNHWLDEAERRKQAIEDLRVHIRDFLAPAAKKTDNMAQVLRANVSKLGRMEKEYDAMPGSILIQSRRAAPSPKKFEAKTRSGDKVFTIKDLALMYERDNPDTEPTIIEVPKLHVDRGDRLAVIGSNGSGKSTLLRVLSGEQEGITAEGLAKVGASVETGYYSPETTLPRTDIPLRVLLGEHTKDPMGILGYWGFNRSEAYDLRGDQLTHRDQTARAQLALIMAKKPNVLLLDEPTSHLTPTFQDRLIEAVNSYEGTLLVISHDPHFLNNIGLYGRVLMPGGKRENLTYDR